MSHPYGLRWMRLRSSTGKGPPTFYTGRTASLCSAIGGELLPKRSTRLQIEPSDSPIDRDCKGGGQWPEERVSGVGSGGESEEAGTPSEARKARPMPETSTGDRARLAKRWSPEQNSHRLKMDFPTDPEMRVSHETIYRSLYVQARGARSDWARGRAALQARPVVRCGSHLTKLSRGTRILRFPQRLGCGIHSDLTTVPK